VVLRLTFASGTRHPITRENADVTEMRKEVSLETFVKIY